jgi:hypothetical protein
VNEAAVAALAAQTAMASHESPEGLEPEISVGVHAGQAGIGWIGAAVIRCMDLCDAAEG